jgi:hypothetical protein
VRSTSGRRPSPRCGRSNLSAGTRFRECPHRSEGHFHIRKPQFELPTINNRVRTERHRRELAEVRSTSGRRPSPRCGRSNLSAGTRFRECPHRSVGHFHIRKPQFELPTKTQAFHRSGFRQGRMKCRWNTLALEPSATGASSLKCAALQAEGQARDAGAAISQPAPDSENAPIDQRGIFISASLNSNSRQITIEPALLPSTRIWAAGCNPVIA